MEAIVSRGAVRSTIEADFFSPDRLYSELRRTEACLTELTFSSGFAELLDGVVSVRAFSAESRFMDALCEQVDKMHSAFYYYWMMNRWVSPPSDRS